MAGDTQPLVLLRYHRGVVGETARTVHLALLPIGDVGEIKTLCGALLPADHVQTLTPYQGMPCTSCLLSPHLTAPALTSSTENPSTAPALPAQNGTDLTPEALTARYQAWGWPVTYDELTSPRSQYDDQIAPVLFGPTREPAHDRARSAGDLHALCPPVLASPTANALSPPLASDHPHVAVMTFRSPRRERALPTFAAGPLPSAVISA